MDDKGSKKYPERGEGFNGPLAETVASRLASILRSDIASGRLKPGERLRIAALAKEHGISGLPVREALRYLSGEGLIEMLPHKGAAVRAVDRTFVENHYDTLEVLEALLAGKCAEKATKDDIERITYYADIFEEKIELGDVGELVLANNNFHRAVRMAARNPEAARMITIGSELISALRIKFGYSVNRVEKVSQDHRNLVSAIREHNADLARAISISHKRSSRADLLSQIEAQIASGGSVEL